MQSLKSRAFPVVMLGISLLAATGGNFRVR